MYQIKIKELKLFGHHGCYEEEQKKGNQFIIDCEINCKKQDSFSDSLDDVVDYVSVIETIKKEFDIQSNLLESLAERMLNAIKLIDNRFEKVSLSITKLNPPVVPQPTGITITLVK